MFEYFYNEILRKTIISFGTLFNGLTIKQEGSTVKVPLAYGPTQKFLARLEQAPNLSQATQISLPRMSFEFTGLTYDSSRKVTTTQTIAVKNPDDGTDIKKVFMPVPYNMQFELAIMCKLNVDALQIVEQILPYFQPQYNLTINLVSLLNKTERVDKKKLERAIETTNFNVLKNKEKNEGFDEALFSKKDKKKKVFFNLGFNNRWKKLLRDDIKKKIESEFTKEMKELGYL